MLKLQHKNPVYGLSINPQNDHVLATAGDDGRILIFDIREVVPGKLTVVTSNKFVLISWYCRRDLFG